MVKVVDEEGAGLGFEHGTPGLPVLPVEYGPGATDKVDAHRRRLCLRLWLEIGLGDVPASLEEQHVESALGEFLYCDASGRTLADN